MIKIGSMYVSGETLEDRVIKVKKDSQKTEELIFQFKPFIASVIQKRLGRYMEYGVDDELSIGLMAFNEAINQFDRTKGKFLSFARLVITNRLIDYYRKQSREKAVSFGYFEDENEESGAPDALDRKSVELFSCYSEQEDIRFEVLEYINLLKKWEINFSDLVRISPKHESLRNEYKKVAKLVAEKTELLDYLERTRRLPIKEIEKFTPIHRKKIERGRIYIIAIIIAIVNRFSFIEDMKAS